MGSDTEQRDLACAQGPGIIRQFSGKLCIVMSEANGCCRNLCLRDTGGPSSSVCLAELSRYIDSDFRGKTGLSMLLWRQIVNLSLSWLCAYQEQCGCIQHTRHLRSGRGEAGPLWAPLWASMAQCHGDTLGVCVSYFSHCCDKILMKQLEEGRKGELV